MDAENSRLEAMLAGHGPRGRTILLEVLHDAQEICGGWLPRPAIERIAEFLEIPVADVYGVTQFYEMFHTEPVGRRVAVPQLRIWGWIRPSAGCRQRGSLRKYRDSSCCSLQMVV